MLKDRTVRELNLFVFAKQSVVIFAISHGVIP